MILQIVTHPVTQHMTREEYLADARPTLATWQHEPELISKFYCENADGALVGVYLWKSRASAEATHNQDWIDKVFEKRGVRPIIEYKEVYMILDNEKARVTEF